jgi:hypothetical protein
MKRFKFLCLLSCTALIFFLTSCGGNDQKNNDATVDSSAINTNTAPQSTVITNPENMMVVTHKVSNFSKWKPSYDAHDSMRLAYGVHNYVIGRSVDDSNTILVATKVDDMAKAKAFAKDPSLKQAMQKGGVTGNPSISYFVAVFQDTAKISSDIRSRTTFTVKDWDAWRKSFESHRQTRLDNGLVDRVFGYDADDNHKVTLVVAVTDTAKARAFWNSDLLKQQRAEGGVTGQPERFVFRVVQRY